MSPHYRFIRWYGELTKRFGMSELIGRLVAVFLLHRKKEISLQELADWTEYSLSAVSQTIDTFVRFGFVERRKRKGDRRALFYTQRSLPEVMQLMLQMTLAEEIRPGIQELRKELDKIQTELQSSIVEEESTGKIATIESLLKESNLMERYLMDLLAVELPKPEE